MKRSPIFLCLVLLGCVSNELESKVVENGKFVLTASKCAPSNCIRYGAFKFLEQPGDRGGRLSYEWISLDPGATRVVVDVQNFQTGTTTGQARFGVGYRDHRFLWRPVGKRGSGEIYPPKQLFKKPQYGGIYCLSTLPDVWRLDIQQLMDTELNRGNCVRY